MQMFVFCALHCSLIAIGILVILGSFEIVASRLVP